MNFALFVSTDPLGVKILQGKPDMVTAVDGANPLGIVYLQVRRTFPLDVTTVMFLVVNSATLGVDMVHNIASLRPFNTIAARVSAAKPLWLSQRTAAWKAEAQALSSLKAPS